MKDVSALAGIIEWWYPVAVWAIVFAAIAREIQTLIESIGAQRSGPRWLPIAVAALAIMPVAGLPLGRWLHGFNANFSIPFVALLLDFTTAPLLRRPLFDGAAKRAALWFGIASGLLALLLWIAIIAGDTRNRLPAWLIGGFILSYGVHTALVMLALDGG